MAAHLVKSEFWVVHEKAMVSLSGTRRQRGAKRPGIAKAAALAALIDIRKTLKRIEDALFDEEPFHHQLRSLVQRILEQVFRVVSILLRWYTLRRPSFHLSG